MFSRCSLTALCHAKQLEKKAGEMKARVGSSTVASIIVAVFLAFPPLGFCFGSSWPSHQVCLVFTAFGKSFYLLFRCLSKVLWFFKENLKSYQQSFDRILNEIAIAIDKTFAGLKCILTSEVQNVYFCIKFLIKENRIHRVGSSAILINTGKIGWAA